MRFRQIHLDFHTSPLIEGIGTAFDPKAFAGAFRDAAVDSVTVFSKCHHGHSYHPTSIGRMHPGLGFDLLRGQIDALHGADIKAPVYLSAAWDEYAADTHPEWRLVSPPGETLVRSRDNNPTGWAFLDFSSPYLDYLGRQVDEVMTNYGDADGIFIDICFQMQSVSIHARRAMEKAGLDWENETDRERFVRDSVRNFYETVTATVRRHDAKMPLFFNSGHVVRGPAARHQAYNTHLELESLPTAGWGYDHFPVSARYVDPLGIPFIGMTGKFHFTWGEIGGYKRPEALVYECGAMLAHGAGCSIGDHLHPTGRIDPATMSIIAPAYQWVAEREPWSRGSQNRAQIGLLSLESVESIQASGAPSQHSSVDDGAVRVLLEAGYSFDVLDTESDFTRYRLLILPDAVPVGAALQQKIEAYVAKGGRVLLTGRSGIDAETGFVFDLGAEWQGTSPMAGGDYARPITALEADGIGEPVFMYVPSERIRVRDGESLGDVYEPYFDRTPKHFSGHIHSPVRPEASGYASGVRKGNYVYCSHPVFSAYHQVGAVRMLEMAEKLIAFALGEPRLVETSLPRAGRVTVRHQAEAQRDIVHLLFATPAMRGNLWDANIQPIQDLVELKDISVRLQVTAAPKSVSLVPSGATLDFVASDGAIDFVVPSLLGHQMIAVNY